MLRDIASRESETFKIVFVINSLRAGGAERQLLRIVTGLRRCSQWEVSVYCLARSGIFVEAMEELGVPVAGPERSWSESPVRLMRTFTDLSTFLRRVRPDIVHCFLDQSNILGSLAASISGVPHVLTSRLCVDQYHGLRAWQHRLTLPLVDRLSDRVVAVCEAARLQALREGTPAEKLVVVPNSVTVPGTTLHRRLVFDGAPVFGCVGEIHPRKGYSQLVEAIPQVLAALPRSRFVVVGGWQERSPDELERLQRRAAELGVRGSIEFLGIRDDIPDLLAAFDVFVMPSVIEGLPNALMEAMATGLPAVTNRVGGVPDLISDGVTGLLVEPGSARDLAEKLVRMGSDERLRERCGAEARRLMETRYAPEREIEENEAVYLDLLRPGRRTEAHPEPASPTR